MKERKDFFKIGGKVRSKTNEVGIPGRFLDRDEWYTIVEEPYQLYDEHIVRIKHPIRDQTNLYSIDWLLLEEEVPAVGRWVECESNEYPDAPDNVHPFLRVGNKYLIQAIVGEDFLPVSPHNHDYSGYITLFYYITCMDGVSRWFSIDHFTMVPIEEQELYSSTVPLQEIKVERGIEI